MKTFSKNILLVSMAALSMTGCGSSSDNNAGTEEEHEHESSVLVSQSDNATLSLFEEGALEALDTDAAGNGATLVLSETGVYAAVLANNVVNFVHGLHEEEEGEHDEEGHEHEEEAHVLDFDLTGSQVITTNGHFAVLNDGSTTFIAYDDLEIITEASEDTSSLSLTETYPALIIDEDHGLKMVFADGNAVFYEDATEKDSFACATPTSHGQTDELVVVSCGATGVVTVVIEEVVSVEDESVSHTFAGSTLTLDGTEANYVWQAQGHVIVGFEPGTSNYAIVELDDDSGEIVWVEGSDTGAFAIERTICDIKLDSEEQDVFVLGTGDTTNAGDKLVVLSHEGEVQKNVTLNGLSDTACDDLVMASASNSAVVVNNSAMKAYDIDAEEGDSYHVHSTYELDVSDVSNVVIFHEKNEDEAAHVH